mgnify:CR=1 FL=1
MSRAKGIGYLIFVVFLSVVGSRYSAGLHSRSFDPTDMVYEFDLKAGRPVLDCGQMEFLDADECQKIQRRLDVFIGACFGQQFRSGIAFGAGDKGIDVGNYRFLIRSNYQANPLGSEFLYAVVGDILPHEKALEMNRNQALAVATFCNEEMVDIVVDIMGELVGHDIAEYYEADGLRHMFSVLSTPTISFVSARVINPNPNVVQITFFILYIMVGLGLPPWRSRLSR